MTNKFIAVLIFVLFSFSALGNAGKPGMTFIGSFTNMKFDNEHAYGSEVELWKDANDIFGLFLHSEGLAGDTPTGRLDNLSFDPKTKSLSFVSKLTIGSHGCRIHHEIPSQDLFQFRGMLKGNTLTGTLRRSDGLHPEKKPIEEKVVLKKEREPSGRTEYKNYAEWRQDIEAILSVRGPKW